MTTEQDFFDAANAEGEGNTEQGGNTYIPKNRPNGAVDFNDPGVGNEGWAQQYGGQGYAVPGYDIRKQGNLIDPWAGLYGGAPGQATNDENRYADMASKARSAAAPQLDYSGANSGFRQADLDAQRQDAAMRNYMDVVHGTAPSVALAQQNAALANANMQARAAAAHIRGGGAGAMAAQRAAANTYGGVASQAIGTGSLGRVGEVQGALAGYGESATAQRAGSLQENKIVNNDAYQQALINERQNALNAEAGLNYEQLRQNVFKDQQQGEQWNEAQNYQAYMQGAGLGLTQGAFDTAERNKYAGAALSAGGDALTNIENASSNPNQTTSDIRAKKDIKPGAASTEAQLDEMHGLAVPNGGQHLESNVTPQELYARYQNLPPEASQAERQQAYRAYLSAAAATPMAVSVPSPKRAPLKAPPRAAVGPTATGDEIARSILGSQQAPYYGPTPTGQEIAGQILGPGGRPKIATIIGGGSPGAAPTTRGLVEPGNIDIHHRPTVRNADGSISTVRSIGVNVDGREVLIPTVSDDGKILSNKQATDLYLKTGKHLGAFDSVDAANAYAQSLHEQQAAEYGGGNLPSDERLKTNVHASGVEDALDHLKPYSYSYKDPSLGEGQRVGIMAQDLERSPVGLSTVIETPRGKAIDVNRGLSLSLASVADLHARVKALEAKRRG